MGKQCIGLDIGTSAIKLVQVKVARRGMTLTNFGIEPVPPQSIVDGVVMNHARWSTPCAIWPIASTCAARTWRSPSRATR